MIIDDELDILDVLRNFLSRSGKVEVKTYSNPDSALKVAQNGNFDLILTDVMMPSTSGLDILKSIKQSNPSIKVIIMTAYSTDSKIEQSNAHGADKYLEKPFQNLKAVENTIFSLLNI